MRLIAFVAAAFFAVAANAAEDDRYVGYYYPEITSEETFGRVITPLPPSSPQIRSGFVTSITKAQLAAPESPRFVLTEKGDDSDRLIIIALDDEVFSTLYRARAVLSQLSSNLRGTEFFQVNNLAVAGTFFDMVQLMQFESIVISDGETWAHRITFEPAE